MEPAAGRSDPNPIPPRRLPPARSPLVPAAGKRIRSAPTVLPPREGGVRPGLLPMEAPAPRRRISRLGIALALLIGVGTVPFTLKFEKNHAAPKSTAGEKTDYNVPIEKRAWRMHGLVDCTEKQAIDRFGTPYLSRNYSMADGSFAGPTVGQKKFYSKTLPDYEARLKNSELVWSFPQYSIIREVVWQLEDSYLTVWMREPRAEIDISKDDGLVALPTAPEDGGDWVVIDNFRLGKDLIKNAPSPSSPAPPPEKSP